MDQYSIAQVWSYKTRPGEEESLVCILRIEEHPECGAIFHIAISDIKLKNDLADGGYQDSLGHCPIEAKSFDESVVELMGVTDALPFYEEGYSQWLESNGGVFNIPIADVVKSVEEVFAHHA